MDRAKLDLLVGIAGTRSIIISFFFFFLPFFSIRKKKHLMTCMSLDSSGKYNVYVIIN